MNEMKVAAHQVSPGVTSDGKWQPARATRDGIPFRATWKQALLMEGACFFMDVGDLADTALTALVRGAGTAGTLTDLDTPSFGVSVANGKALLPLDIAISCSADLDANDEVAEALILADIAAAYAIGAGAVTAVTASPMISDGSASAATCFRYTTTAITDPTCSMILAHELVREVAVTDTTMARAVRLHLDYKPGAPVILKGPAAFYGYWGGTTLVLATASVVWAETAESRFNL